MKFIVEIRAVDLGPTSMVGSSTYDPEANTLFVSVAHERLHDVNALPLVVGHEVSHFLYGMVHQILDGRHPKLATTIRDVISVGLAELYAKQATEKQDPLPFTKPRTIGEIVGVGILPVPGKGTVTLEEFDPLPPADAIEQSRRAHERHGSADNDHEPFVDPEQKSLTDMMRERHGSDGPFRHSEPPPKKTYDVTWRRPTWGYAHDVIEATTAKEALGFARSGWNKRDLHWEVDSDSMDPVDWCSVEGWTDDTNRTVDHAEWSDPGTDASRLKLALVKIELFTSNAKLDNPDPKVAEQALKWIGDEARKALGSILED